MSLREYTSYVEILKGNKSDFITIKSGSSAQVVINGKTPKKFLASNYITPGMHLCNIVRKDVMKRIHDGVYKPKDRSEWHKIYTTYYIPEKIVAEKKFLAIDISSCYFRTMYMIGAIGEETYKAGYKKDGYKLARNISVGSLGKITTIEHYKDGKSFKVEGYRDPLFNVRFDVLEYVDKIAKKIIHQVRGQFFMYLTDCFFVERSAASAVQELLSQEGFKSTLQHGKITGLEERDGGVDKVSWRVTDDPEDEDEHAQYFSTNNIFTKYT